ncbi:MAG: molecular chaperone TorD family protein [Psychromonas sp.]
MIINAQKLLGAVFHQAMPKNQLIEIISALNSENVLSENCLAAVSEEDESLLQSEFSLLFEGIGDMPAPPWGSVYLDKDQIVFGQSTLDYRYFLEQNGIELDTGTREPEDQIGLMLLGHAYLLSENRSDAAKELMQVHLLPWVFHYLERLKNSTNSRFYQCLSVDTTDWLNSLVTDQQLIAVDKKLYLE